MEIKNKPTLAEKQAFWAEQLPNFEAKYWLPSHFELLEFDMEGGNYEVRDVLPEHYSEDDASDIYHRVNTGWAMWKKAINFTKAQAVPEWISTSDRMPKEGEEVLVHSLGQVRQVTRDSKWAGGFKERNCYGWQAAYGKSHWMPKSIGLPEEYHFYYKNDAKQKAIIEAQEQSHD